MVLIANQRFDSDLRDSEFTATKQLHWHTFVFDVQAITTSGEVSKIKLIKTIYL